MNDRNLYLTLAGSAALTLALTLLRYHRVSPDNDLIARVPYGLFVSVLPALGTLVVLKVTRLSWRWSVLVYCLFVALVLFQLMIRNSFTKS
jgi:uncharacterized membrane protein